MAVLSALVNKCTVYLDMSHAELKGREAGCAIGRVLSSPTIALKHLNVEHNALGCDGLDAVFGALRRNGSLEHLDVSDNGAGPAFGTQEGNLDEHGTTSIESAVSLNQSLRFLDLGSNGLCAQCGVHFTAALRMNRALVSICLENNLLDDESALAIARKLRKDRQIEHLDLGGNRIGWHGGQELAAALALNRRLTSLDLGRNRIGEGGTVTGIGAKLADALVRNSTLVSLNLEANTLGPTGGIAIARALHCNNSLTDLNLLNNR